MANNIDIENYRGQLIQYDEDYDKFVCDISIEDKWKKTKRQSLIEVRKEIDSFIKLNAEFKPFKFLYLDKYDKTFVEKNCTAIRSDGKFVVEGEGYSGKSYLTAKEMSKAMIFDNDVWKEKEKFELERDEYMANYRKNIAALCEKLTPVDLSMYAHISQKEQESLT